MLIVDDRVKKAEVAMDKIELDKASQEQLRRRNAQLSAILRRLNRESESVKRSGDMRKIARFNKEFVSITRELTIIRGKIGRTNRDDVVETVKKWEEKK